MESLDSSFLTANGRAVKSDKLCACGCGEYTNIASGNNLAIPIHRGEAHAWVSGHQRTFNNWTPVVGIDCWVWTGSLNSGGYGQHRRVYERYVGKIPEALELDHLCRNRWCVNPDHLEPVTQGENIRRAYPTCAAGHDWSHANTYEYNGHRMCRLCRARNARDFRARRVAA